MKRKVKRYDEGGQTMAVDTPDIEETETRRSITDRMMNLPLPRSGGYTSPVKDDNDSEKTFKQAFAEARRAGDKTFEFGGKKYTTDLAKQKAKTSTPDESSAETARLMRQSKSDETPKSAKRGFGPKITFGTPAQLEKAKKAYYSGFKAGGKVSSASKRADGIATKGKTRGRIC